MDYLNQLLMLPYASLWVPGVVFVVIVGGVSACMVLARPAPQLASVEIAPFINNGTTALGTVVKAKADEKRQSRRRQGNPIAIYLANPDYKHEPERCCVTDRSMGGMLVVLKHAIEPGTVISIRPVNAEDMVPWLDLEVRSCRPNSEFPGEFDLGCQYVKTPPYSIMLLYG